MFILTGSQIPGEKIESDARRNLVNAFRVAIMDISGVFIVFDERIILGSRASKASESKLDAFQSINSEDAGEIAIAIKIKDWVKKEVWNHLKLKSGRVLSLIFLSIP